MILMKGLFMKTTIIILLITSVSVMFGGLNYIGYSGAPGSLGTCAISCHGPGGGTLYLIGFPAYYVPGQTYTITVKYGSGLKIGNFNVSIRKVSDNTRAGTITALYRTATYNVSAESNGVRLSPSNQDSAKFNWMAPTTIAGDIKLYFGGTQGTSINAPNTTIVLTSASASGQTEANVNQVTARSLRIEPSVVKDYINFLVSLIGQKDGQLKIIQSNGRVIYTIPISAGQSQVISWAIRGESGKKLAAGAYYAALICGTEQTVKRFVITK